MITTKKIDPRPYQQKAAAAIHREWDAGNKKTLVVMPTGTGKTIVFASIVNDQVEKGEHVLILAHREELLQQASDKDSANGTTSLCPGSSRQEPRILLLPCTLGRVLYRL